MFAVGFVLGLVRRGGLPPANGERWAEPLETPFMLVVICLVAGRVVERFDLRSASLARRAGVGLIVLGLLLTVELGRVLQLRGLTVSESLATRDAVSGSVYAVSLLVFAATPTLVASVRRSSGAPRRTGSAPR